MYIRKENSAAQADAALQKRGTKNRNQDSPPKEVGVFSFHRELRPMKQKNAPRDAHSREVEICR